MIKLVDDICTQTHVYLKVKIVWNRNGKNFPIFLFPGSGFPVLEYGKVRIITYIYRQTRHEKKESRLLCNCKWLHTLKDLQLLCRKKMLPFQWRYTAVYTLHAKTKHDLRDISVFFFWNRKIQTWTLIITLSVTIATQKCCINNYKHKHKHVVRRSMNGFQPVCIKLFHIFSMCTKYTKCSIPKMSLQCKHSYNKHRHRNREHLQDLNHTHICDIDESKRQETPKAPVTSKQCIFRVNICYGMKKAKHEAWHVNGKFIDSYLCYNILAVCGFIKLN